MNSMNHETDQSVARPLTRTTDLANLLVVKEENGDETGESLITFDTEWLDLSRSLIEEKETKIMARALESNRVVNLKVLFLHKNAGDVGMRAMLNALTLGYLQGLEKLVLWEVSSYDQITTAEEGTDTIAEALAKGRVPDLHTLDLTGSLPKLIAPRQWKKVCGDFAEFSTGSGRLKKFMDTCCVCLCLKSNSGGNQTLDCLRCQFFKEDVFSGDDGIRKIVAALRTHPLTSLKFLNLGENYIGDKGVSSLAKLLAGGLLPQLQELDLHNNPVGRKGAEDMVSAFLDNPVLTVRVKMDWPTLLLKERASAFRECNIRLEHRLAELKITLERNNLSDLFEWRPDYYLRRPPVSIVGYKDPHRLHMQCQAPDHDKNQRDDPFLQGEGIQIRRRPCFGTSSRKYVDRELREEKMDDRTFSRSETIPSSRRTRTPTSGSIQVSDNVQGAVPSTYHSLQVPPSSSSNQGSVDAQDSQALQKSPIPSTSYKSSGRSSSGADLENAKALPRHKGVNHIYITAGSCGFIGAAKALGVQTKKGFFSACYSFVRRTLQNEEKTKEHIDSIMEELLMLADRKPHEFHQMFNLRRVLLRDENSIHYPAYVCSNCYSRLEGNGDFIKPVIHKALLEVSRVAPQSSPTSSPSVRNRKYFPKFDKQPSRLR